MLSSWKEKSPSSVNFPTLEKEGELTSKGCWNGDRRRDDGEYEWVFVQFHLMGCEKSSAGHPLLKLHVIYLNSC